MNTNKDLDTSKENTLYIIGNGFDLYHSINSKYQDFHEYLIRNNSEVKFFFDSYFILSEDSHCLWADFENDLSSFHDQLFLKDHSAITPNEWCDQEKPKWSDWHGTDDEVIQESEIAYKAISDLFLEWIRSLTPAKKKKLHFNNNSKFFSFNYTPTLKTLYNIPPEKVLHIHGDTMNSNNSVLIFGHGEKLKEIDEFDKNGDSVRVPWSDAEKSSLYLYNHFRKPVEEIIEKNINFFETLNNIKDIVVLGHSLRGLDMLYFKKIKEVVTNECKWKFVYYSKQDENNMIEKVENLGLIVGTEKCQLLTWKEYKKLNIRERILNCVSFLLSLQPLRFFILHITQWVMKNLSFVGKNG